MYVIDIFYGPNCIFLCVCQAQNYLFIEKSTIKNSRYFPVKTESIYLSDKYPRKSGFNFCLLENINRFDIYRHD